MLYEVEHFVGHAIELARAVPDDEAHADEVRDAHLVVALHGCTQTAAEYKKAGWDTFAERFGFYVLYPEVTSGAKCFGWFETSNTRRGAGQAASIAQAVEWMRSRYGIDSTRIFVSGLSAGGGMTASLLASYPDVFAAGATMAGLPAQCASSIGGSSSCQQGLDKTAQQWGDLVRAAAPAVTSRWPRVAIWNGDADYTVTARSCSMSGCVRPSGACGSSGWMTGCCLRWSSMRALRSSTRGLLRSSMQALPVVDAGTPVVDAGTPAGSCVEFNDTNYNQVQAGRAVRCGQFNSYTCANGSGENVGLWNTFYKSWLSSRDGAFWSATRCP